MNVYVLIRGEYDEKHVVGVYTTLERAQDEHRPKEPHIDTSRMARGDFSQEWEVWDDDLDGDGWFYDSYSHHAEIKLLKLDHPAIPEEPEP